MEDPYGKVKGGRLTFKGGAIPTLSKSIDKKKKKKKIKNKHEDVLLLSLDEAEYDESSTAAAAAAGGGEGSSAADKTTTTAGGGGEIYTIDAAKRMKYEELFPVEAKKFSYRDPKSNVVKSVEDALDDRVKKKADRYCK